MGLELQTAVFNPTEEVLLREGEDEDNRNQCHNSTSQHQLVRRSLSGILNCRQFQHQGVLIVVNKHEQREKEVGPSTDEGCQANNRESSTYLREENPPETRPFTRPINQCCVFNFFGDSKESRAHHEDLEGADHGDHPHTGKRLVRAD